MLPAVLTLSLALPSYVGCSSESRFRLLAPRPEEVAPTNTAVWLLEFVNAPEGGRPRLLDLDDAREVAAIELTTPLRSGLLLELRPLDELLPLHRYAIEVPGSDPIPFSTGADPDRLRPEMPDATESDGRPPLAHCLRSASILVHTKTSEPDLLLIGRTAKHGDLAIARGEELEIPAAEGEQLSLSVVAMDLAGNRSTSSLPFPASAGGCSATSPSGGAVLALLPIFLLVKRRRR